MEADFVSGPMKLGGESGFSGKRECGSSEVRRFGWIFELEQVRNAY